MSASIQTAVSDGTMTFLDVSIGYLDRSEISVYFNDIVTSDWDWSNSVDSRIVFQAPSTPVPNGITVKVKRTTDLTALRHEFSKGAAFTAETLDEDLTQILHIAQEAYESAPSGEFFQDINMHGYGIHNLANGSLPGDAVTYGQYTSDLDGVAQARAAAEAAQAAAEAAEVAAEAAAASAAGAADYAISRTGIVTVWADGVTDNSASIAAANSTGRVLAHAGTGPWIIGTPVTITLPILDTYKQLFRVGDSVTIDNASGGRPVIRGDWFGASTIGWANRAVAATPSQGGIIKLRARRYASNGHQYGFGGAGVNISKDNISFVGEQMPFFNNDCTGLVGGTVIEGQFNAYANNFSISNVGIDSGLNVLNSLYGGVPAPGFTEAMGISYPNDAVKAAGGYKRGIRMHNVIGLAARPTDLVHSMLAGEGVIDFKATGRLIGMYGVHGVVFKCQDVQAETIEGYCCGTDAIILKSDLQTSARCLGVKVVRAIANAGGPDGYSPHMTALGLANCYGLLLNPSGGEMDNIHIQHFTSQGYPVGIGTSFGGNYELSSVRIDHAWIDGANYTGSDVKRAISLVAGANQPISRFRVGYLESRNNAVGFQAQCTAPLGGSTVPNGSVGAMHCVGGQTCIDIGSSAQFVVDSLTGETQTDAIFRFTGTPKLVVGTLYRQNQTPTVVPLYSSTSGGLVPSFNTAAWSQISNNSGWNVEPGGSGWRLRGLIAPTATPSATIMTLPPWCRPLAPKRFLAQCRAGGVGQFTSITVGTDGIVVMNEGTYDAAKVGQWLSLDGITWDSDS